MTNVEWTEENVNDEEENEEAVSQMSEFEEKMIYWTRDIADNVASIRKWVVFFGFLTILGGVMGACSLLGTF